MMRVFDCLTTISDSQIPYRRVAQCSITLLVLLAGLCLVCTAQAQSGVEVRAKAQYRLDQWTADTGLPQNSVYAVVQTRDNYIWLATLDGLVRFDGVRFTVFNKSNSPGISNNRFVYLYEDARGDLWAGTEQSGVVRLHQGRFTSYGIEHGLPSLRVVWLNGDANGSVLVYPPGMKPAVRWSGEKFVPFEPSSVSSPVASATPREPQTIFCQQDSVHLGCFVNESYERFLYADGFPNFRLTFFYNSAQDTTRAHWLATADAGLVKIENGKFVRAYTKRDGLPDFPVRIVTGARLSLLAKDEQGALWLTDTETMQKQLLMRQPPETLLIPEEVRAAFADREGHIWFGTTRGGLFRVRQQFITTYSKPDGLLENNIYPIYEARDGVVWIGTTKGLFKYEGGVFTQEKSAGAGNISAIAEDGSGRLLVGGENVRALEGGGRSIPIFDDRPQIRIIYAIYPNADGTLWIGGQGGLVRFKDGVPTVYTTKDGLAGDEVKVIIDDENGGIWIGIYGGLTHYKDGRLTSWTEKDGLPSHTIRSLYQDRDGVLWIGSYDGGLARFKDGKFTRYDMKIGLHNDGVFQILEDAQRNFWISSNRGIYRVRKDELNEFAEGRRSTITSIAYGKSDGMLNVECNGGRSPAGTKTRDGRLWFPTQDGVAVIDPKKVTVNPQPPPVVIESFLLDRAPISFDGEVKIQPHQTDLEIQYTALSFINSENLRFKYQLEGLDADWIEAGTRRTAYYSHVPAGEYTFKVIAANSDGIWNQAGKSLKITVLPPFYKTWWFLTLAGLCLFGVASAVFKTRVNQVEKARKAQEEFSRKLLASQEQERQRIAAALHDSLGQSLLIIKNRVALAQSDIDEKETVEEQLGELSDSATSAIEECREIAYNLRPFQISRFGLSKTLYGIFMRINEVTEINATTEIDNIDDCLTDEAQINVYRIVQECVNNIIKHSHVTAALLAIQRTNDGITLLIADNGRGFVPTENNGGHNQTGGFGLIGITERVKMLHGSYEIDSASGRGTSVRIRLTNQKGR